MPKRFIDSNLFKKSFIRCLKAPLKLLWIYLFCDCDNSGIWDIDYEVASLYLGFKVNEEELRKLKNKIVVIDEGKKLFIPDFIEFQYGELNQNNPAHKNVIKQLSKYQLIDSTLKVPLKELESTFEGTMDMDKDKDKEKRESVREKKTFIPPDFDEVKRYFIEHDCTEKAAKNFYESYSVADWHDSKGNQIKNWKQKAIQVWFTNEKNQKHKMKVDSIRVPTKEEYQNDEPW